MEPGRDIDGRIHFSGLNLLQVAAADVGLLGKLLLSQDCRHAQTMHIFSKFLMWSKPHSSHRRDARLFESEAYRALLSFTFRESGC